MKRVANPVLLRSGESALRQYEQVLCEQEDLTPASVRNYLSEVRQLMAWYEAQAAERPDPTCTSQSIATPTLTRYRLGDRVLLVVLLHSGLRAREVCRLRYDQAKFAKRSGFLEIIGKRNTYREVPLNTIARNALKEYFATLPSHTVFLFPSGKTKEALSDRALGYILKKYGKIAKLTDMGPHDLRHR